MTSDEKYKRACEIVGVDPKKVRNVTGAEFARQTGFKPTIGEAYTAKDLRLITFRGSPPLYVYIHELLHILFPFRTHGWIFRAAWKLSGTKHPSSDIYKAARTNRVYTTEGETTETKQQLQRLSKNAATRLGVAR